MSELMLSGDARVALSHMAAIGLAAIIEEGGDNSVSLRWTAALASRALITTERAGWQEVARAVREHARAHIAESNWTAASVGGDGDDAGLLSPRIKTPDDAEGWRRLTDRRRDAFDGLVTDRRWLDLRMIGALGEPAYWRFDRQGKPRPDDGASRWEMKTRNRGEDFVRHRLRKLASSVASRDIAAVHDGLTGAALVDEIDGSPGSRTATGLANPGPADNAVAWCALWGISQFPVVPRISRQSSTSGHISIGGGAGSRKQDLFCIPVPARPVRLARLRSVIVSRQLADTAAAAASGRADEIEAQVARQWLLARGIGAVAVFPIGVFGSANAPERRALTGEIVWLGQ